MWLPWWLSWWRNCLQCRKPQFTPWVRMILWRREWQPTLVFLPGKSHGQRSWWATVHRFAKSRTWLQCLNHNHISMAKLSELMEQYWCVIVKQNPCLNQIFLSFFFLYFLFQDPIQHTILYLVIHTALGCDTVWDSPCFGWCCFEEY